MIALIAVAGVPRLRRTLVADQDVAGDCGWDGDVAFDVVVPIVVALPARELVTILGDSVAPRDDAPRPSVLPIAPKTSPPA